MTFGKLLDSQRVFKNRNVLIFFKFVNSCLLLHLLCYLLSFNVLSGHLYVSFSLIFWYPFAPYLEADWGI